MQANNSWRVAGRPCNARAQPCAKDMPATTAATNTGVYTDYSHLCKGCCSTHPPTATSHLQHLLAVAPTITATSDLHPPSQLTQWKLTHLLPPPHAAGATSHTAAKFVASQLSPHLLDPPPHNHAAPPAARPCADPNRPAQLRRCNASNAGTCSAERG